MTEIKVTTRDGCEIKVLYYSAAKQNAPLLMEIHGGGFKYGCAEDDRVMCEELAANNGVNAASVDYRLAPESVYPCATLDCVDALLALMQDSSLSFDRTKIALIGHSAGANIAAGMCHYIKDTVKISGQILTYPMLDVTKNKRKYVFTSFLRLQLKLTNDAYFPDKNRRGEFEASPLCGSKEQLKGLPPALIFTAGIDTLAPDGEQYARLLRGAGVECIHIHEKLARHGYFEVVPNGHINGWWWVNKKSREEQLRCYNSAHKEIKKFLNKVFTENI